MITNLNMDAETKSIHTKSSLSSCVASKWMQEGQLLKNVVSGENLCQTENAQRLCLNDVSDRLRKSGTYSIGGTYTEEEPDIWFYYTTTECPGYNYLMNVFALHRKIGTFSVAISDSNEIDTEDKSSSSVSDVTENPQHIVLSEKLSWKTFVSAKSNVSHHIKTYCFNEMSTNYLEHKIIWIPIAVKLNTEELDKETEQRIKENHAITISSITKRNKTDFVLESTSKKQYPTHKILLLAHSPVLRDMIRNSSTNTLFIDISDKKMELLIHYLHTGTLKDIGKDMASDVLDFAVKFKLRRLEALMVAALQK